MMLAALAAAAAAAPDVQSKNPILPAGNELVWGTFSFLVLFALMVKFGIPSVRKAMEARTERIRGDLSAAEQAKVDAQTLLDQYQSQLADARSEANRIIEEARQAADGLRRELMTKAEADVAELRARATADIQAAKDRAMAELRSQLTTLTIELAERVVKRNLDREANAALVDEYISSLAGS
jgi:F-type H+-transporting ATPase subunit b